MNNATVGDGLSHGLPDDHPGRAQKRRWIEGGLIVAFWAVIGLLTIAQHAFDPRFAEHGGLRAGEVLHTLLEYAVWATLTPGIFWLSRRFSLERRDWLRHLLLHVFVAVAVSAAVDLLDHAAWNVLVAEGPRRPVSLTAVLSGFHILAEFLLYLIVLAAGFARDYFLRYRERLTEAIQLRTQAAELRTRTAELQAQLAEAHLQALRMQINPHFLFNTLHTISTYIERDPRGARRMIARLSELLRYTLEKTHVKEVPLGQELGFLDGYLEIQSIRFQDRLEVHKEIDAEVLDALVPNLILQPLVENAVKHGVSQVEETGRIVLSAWREGEWLHLSVRDNGPGLGLPVGDGAPASPGGIGLRNTRERLESLYGEEQSLVLAPAKGGGAVARISLPYHTSADLYTTAV